MPCICKITCLLHLHVLQNFGIERSSCALLLLGMPIPLFEVQCVVQALLARQQRPGSYVASLRSGAS